MSLESLRAHSRHDKTARTYVYARDSFHATVDDCAAFLHGADTLAGNDNSQTRAAVLRRATGGDPWTFDKYGTMDAWRAAMLAGDESGAARVAKFQGAVSTALVSPLSAKRKITRGPQGDEVCPHAILAGRLDRAWTFRRRMVGRAPAPVVILVPMTSNADAGAESFAWRSAVALALAGPMQRAGYRVSIVAADAVVGSYSARGAPQFTGVFHRVASGVNLDIPRVSAAMSAPHLRLVTFAVIASAPFACYSGLGRAVDEPETYLTMALSAGMVRAGEEVLTVPATLRNEASARKWLADTSARYGKQS